MNREQTEEGRLSTVATLEEKPISRFSKKYNFYMKNFAIHEILR